LQENVVVNLLFLQEKPLSTSFGGDINGRLASEPWSFICPWRNSVV